VYRQTSCCRFAAVGSVAGDIDRLLQQRRATGECGQRHFVSVRIAERNLVSGVVVRPSLITPSPVYGNGILR